MILKATIFLFFSAVFLPLNVESYSILGVVPIPAKSHHILIHSLFQALAERGHETVLMSPFADKIPANLTYTQIQLKEVLDLAEAGKGGGFTAMATSAYGQMMVVNEIGLKCTETILSNKKLEDLLKSDRKFDAIVYVQFHAEALKFLSWHYKAPTILLSTLFASGWLNPLVANPSPPSYIPELTLDYTSDMTFWQRVHNFFNRVLADINREVVFLPAQRRLLRKYHPQAPGLDSLIYNVSLVLMNADVSMNIPTPYVPNMIDVGGFHIKPPKTLPSDLQKFLDDSDGGVVYFSMGSYLRAAALPDDKRAIFLRVFSRLNGMKVLWKWEDDKLPGQTENVEIRKWLPQPEILSHPNVKVFITHGGLLSTTEAIYHGKPILSIPVFGDQKQNAANAVTKGFGLTMHYENITEEYFEQALHELLHNPSFKENAKKVSKIFHDRPKKPIDTAIFWVEYVIRHRGATHLQVGGLKLNFLQYFLIDVLVVAGTLFLIGYIMLEKTVIKLCERLRRTPKTDKMKSS